MKRAYGLLVLFLAFATLAPAIALAQIPTTEAERQAVFKSLTWRTGETLKLPISSAQLSVPPAIRALVGPDAVKFYEALNGLAAPAGLEAVLHAPANGATLYVQKASVGYIRLDDWLELDADALLKQVSEQTEEANSKRKAAGVDQLHVVGWIERPQLDKTAATARWAFEVRDGDTPVINSIALVLTRDGFYKLTWVGEKSTVKSGLLEAGIANLSVPPGSRHSDYKPGDKVAEYGIAGLIAAMLGVKIAAKVGLLALAAIFLKKFGVILVAAAGGAVAWAWRRMRRKSPEGQK